MSFTVETRMHFDKKLPRLAELLGQLIAYFYADPVAGSRSIAVAVERTLGLMNEAILDTPLLTLSVARIGAIGMKIESRNLGCIYEYLRFLGSIYTTAEGIRADANAWKNTAWNIGETAVDLLRRLDELATYLHKQESETLVNFGSCVHYLNDRKMGLPTTSIVASRYLDWRRATAERTVVSLIECLTDGHGCDAELVGPQTRLTPLAPAEWLVRSQSLGF